MTFLTEDSGQVRAIAKGVRRPKSKLAGGIQLLSECDVTFMEARGELHLVRSARISRHFGNIIKDYERMLFAYRMIEAVHTLTEDIDEPAAYTILTQGLASVDNHAIPLAVTSLWFYLQALMMMGQQPNLTTDASGKKLATETMYNFKQSQSAFVEVEGGKFGSDHIKTARLLLKTTPEVSAKVSGVESPAQDLLEPIQTMFDRSLTLGSPS